MRTFELLAASLLAGAITSTGCTETRCNLIGYDNGLVLELATGSNAGAYQVQFEAENQLLVVDASIAADGQVTCVDNCSDQAQTLTIKPDFPPPPATLGFLVRGTTDPDWGPAAFHLRVLRDQGLVHDQDYTPVYLRSEPNGEGCGEHVYARIPVDLTQP